MISPEDLSLYKLTDSVEAAVDEILQFFRVYHSMRYVKQQARAAAARAAHPLLLDAINREFADILADGDFHQRRSPAAEKATKPSSPTCRGWCSASTAAASAACGSLIDAINRGSVLSWPR